MFTNASLIAQNEWLKDRLSDLQLSSRDPRNIEQWLVECGMPVGELADQAEYTEGVAGDGPAILRDGVPMKVSDILSALNSKMRETANVYTIGDNTMARVFKPSGLTNVADLQAVFDAVELALTEKALKERSRSISAFEEAIRPFASGSWGKIKAWIVNGAPDQAQGVEAAKQLTKLNATVDEILALPDEWADDPAELNGWQPIDSAPKDGSKIDLWVRIRPSKMDEPETFERFPGAWWDADRNDWKLGHLRWHAKFYADAHIPVLWMPLPTPPVRAAS